MSFFSALLFGAVAVSPLSVWQALVDTSAPELSVSIVQIIRLPRALLAMAVGANLAVCGAILQGLFRNPLADPSLIGVSAGASVGASLMIVLSASLPFFHAEFNTFTLVSIGAFSGGLLAVWIVYRTATNDALGTSVATMLLVGIAISALAGSVTGLLEYFSDNEMLRRMSLWRMGGLDGANMTQVSFAYFIVAIQVVMIPNYSRALNTLLLGESQARHLGINVIKLKKHLIVLVAAGVGIAVALAGSIAFVGLVVPHMVRLVMGPDHRHLLPLSMLVGAILLLVSDTIARTVMAPTELPVGLITAFVGAPFFVSLLRMRQRYNE